MKVLMNEQLLILLFAYLLVGYFFEKWITKRMLKKDPAGFWNTYKDSGVGMSFREAMLTRRLIVIIGYPIIFFVGLYKAISDE